jgi:hypothetical protein
LIDVTDGVGDNAPAPGRGWFRRRGEGIPAREERQWVHPSELPNFEGIRAYDPTQTFRPRTALVALMGLILVGLAVTMLVLRTSTPPVTGRQNQFATSITQLPAYAQRAARTTVELVVAADGHVTTVGAMVIAPGDLAVTTDPIPPNASIMGSSSNNARFPVQYVSYNDVLGFSIVQLAVWEPVTPTAQLPDSSTVLAISPFFTTNSVQPEIAYASTTLSDPILKESDGVVSYLATPSDANLDGLVDALAVDQSGRVVAVLSGHGEWFSAAYVTKVAQVITENGGCHASMGVEYTTASGGGVLIVKVLAGPAQDHLRRGDVLTAVDTQPLGSSYVLQAYLYASPAPQALTFTLLRGGKLMTSVVDTGCQP